MKAKNLFLLTMVLLFGAVIKSSGQITPSPFYTSYFPSTIPFISGGAASGGYYNTFLGSQVGTANNSSANYGNTFVGYIVGNNNNGGENTVVGYKSFAANTSGQQNVALGSTALPNNTVGHSNIAIGYHPMTNNTSGCNNIAIGNGALELNQTGYGNLAIGKWALRSYNSSVVTDANNVGIGPSAGYQLLTGRSNTLIGFSAGYNLITGNFNTFIGNVVLPTSISTNTAPGTDTSRSIVLADGQGSQRFYIHNNGFAGIGLANNVIPQNTLEVKALTGSPTQTGGFPASGLRLSNLTNTNFNTIAPTSNRRVLTVNGTGDVILVDDIGGGINASCSTAGFLPVNSSTANTLACSQIYDNGTSVGIGLTNSTTNNWSYTWLSTNGPANTPSSGTVKLDVNGVIRTTGLQALSDRKFKKDIRSIENALKIIETIDGKTYKWNKESNKEMNFDDGDHSGFIAQELEKVLPHIVTTDASGSKAVNYIELIPYLVEAIKEQQIQIDELKSQITNTFKIQNQDLIQLENTKIISVSPNPSNDVISVSLNIEKSVQTATLNVYDLNGKLMSSLNINDRSTNITKTLQKDNFGTGVYILSLVVNGKSIDSKKIVFK